MCYFSLPCNLLKALIMIYALSPGPDVEFDILIQSINNKTKMEEEKILDDFFISIQL
jgi:hypothetical protein